jgi:AraC-like DNA-binding protein
VSYREHTPPAALAPWLDCIWERRADGQPVRVLPDGCIDVVWTEGAGTQIVGANTTAFVVPAAAGTRVVGARLWPGAGPALLGVSAEDLRDARLPIDELWAGAGARLAAALEAQLDPIGTLRAALLILAQRAQRPDPLVRAAVIGLARPQAAVAELAGELCVSERQLRRRVCAAVGYGPKRLARVLRLLRALGAARAGDDLARVAFDAGYADQSHFANECRGLTGVPPSVLLAS